MEHKQKLPGFLAETPDHFKGYINGPLCRKVERRSVEMPKYIDHITREQAQEDFDTLRYVIDVAYSAKESWELHGLDFAAEYARIGRYLDESGDIIQISNLFEEYCKIFALGDCDGHLSMTLRADKRRFKRIYRPYLLDGVVCEQCGGQYVAASDAEGIKRGDVISGCDFFPTLAPRGKEYFLPGVRLPEPIGELTVEVNGRGVTLKAHVIRVKPNRRGKFIYKHYIRQGIDIVDSSSCLDTSDKELKLAEELYALGRTLRDKPVVIWEATTNGGGENEYPERFIQGLNDYANLEVHKAILFSPLTDQAHYELDDRSAMPESDERCWKFVPFERTDSSKGTFKGRLIVLMDNGNASSGEGVIAYSRSVPGAITIGENSMGCNNFGGVPDYRLPHTGVILHMANGIMSGLSDELMGITPTYWTDAENIQDEVLRWLAEPDDYFPKL